MKLRPITRDILVVLAAFLLSERIGALLLWIVFRTHPLRPEDFSDTLGRVVQLNHILVYPIGALVVGTTVGLFATRRVWLLATIAMTPDVAVDLLAGDAFPWRIARSIIYLSIAYCTALGLSWWRKRRATAPRHNETDAM